MVRYVEVFQAYLSSWDVPRQPLPTCGDAGDSSAVPLIILVVFDVRGGVFGKQ